MKKQTKRLQFDFDDLAYSNLEHLEEVLAARTKGEVIRRALSVLRFFVDHNEQGHRFYVETDEGKERMHFFI